MFGAIKLRHKNDSIFRIPIQRTIYRIMKTLGLSHHPKHSPHGITKADRKARKSDDLLKRDFYSEKPLEKCITDITETKSKDSKLYVSAILGLSLDTNMKATLAKKTLDNAYMAYAALRGAVIHSDRSSQYTSDLYRKTIKKYGIIQS